MCEGLDTDDKFRKQWKGARQRIDDVRKLFHTFSHAYDVDMVDGSVKKKIPPRPDLQLQRELYRKEAVRLTNECNEMLQRAYVQDGDRKRFRKELFE